MLFLRYGAAMRAIILAAIGLAGCTQSEVPAPQVQAQTDVAGLEARVDDLEAEMAQMDKPHSDWLEKSEDDKRVARLEARVQQLEFDQKARGR